MKQLTIFDLDEATDYKTIKNKLSKYSIDKLYDREFKGKSTIFSEIHDRLSKQKDYKDYMSEFVNELLKIVPIIESSYKFDEKGIWRYNNEPERYGYQVTKVIVDGLSYNAMSGPFYCLDMLPRSIFYKGDD